MDVRRLSPSGRALWILVLAGLWLLMVQPGNSRRISLRRRSNQDDSQGDAESIQRRGYRMGCQKTGCDWRVAGNKQEQERHNQTAEPKRIAGHGMEEKRRPASDASNCYFYSCKNGYCSSGKCVCFSGYTGSNCDKEASSTEDLGMIICVIVGSTLGTIIVFFGIACCFNEGCCGKDTATILPTARIEENVYEDIAVISSGSV